MPDDQQNNGNTNITSLNNSQGVIDLKGASHSSKDSSDNQDSQGPQPAIPKTVFESGSEGMPASSGEALSGASNETAYQSPSFFEVPKPVETGSEVVSSPEKAPSKPTEKKTASKATSTVPEYQNSQQIVDLTQTPEKVDKVNTTDQLTTLVDEIENKFIQMVQNAHQKPKGPQDGSN